MKLWVDAGTKNNGRPNQESRVCVHAEKQLLIDRVIGDYTSNEAELTAIVLALKQGATTVFTDSKVALSWVTKGWTKKHEKRLKKEKLTPRHKKMIRLAHSYWLLTGSPEIKWVSRDENTAGVYLEEKYGI